MNQVFKGDLYKAACRRYLRFFIKEAFPIVNPGAEFLDNWHIDLISEYLESITKCEIKRLIINIPPRSLKSICISVCWPAWLLGTDPTRRIICASYSQNLSNKLSLDCRHLMRSNWFSNIFPDTTIAGDQNQKNKFLTKHRGFRLATSVGGTITGEGGNFLILDDPHNAIDVNSSKKRENAICWFQQSFSSRLDNKKTGVIIIIMQRLHIGDLTGFLLEKQPTNWHLLNIPAISADDIYYEINGFKYFFKKNHFLHPAREGVAEIHRAKNELGSSAFAAQYLQNPIAEDGGMVKKSWLKYYTHTLAIDDYDHIMQSWDTAIKSGDRNSYSVCTTWGKLNDQFYLLDVFRERVEYPALKNRVTNGALLWQPDLILIEDKASGQSLLQDLKREHPAFSLVAVKTKSDKITRFARVTPLFESGQVILSKNANWLIEYEQELLSFPGSKHNDQVDSTSQYLQHIILMQVISYPNIRSL
jgi:predicted phage terminase large subunit-like protein